MMNGNSHHRYFYMVAVSLIASTSVMCEALASTAQDLPSPVFHTADSNGVELASGRYSFPSAPLPHIFIGTADEGLDYYHIDALMNNNHTGYISQQACDTTRYVYTYMVTLGDRSAIFDSHNTGSPYCLSYQPPFTLDQGSGAQTLTATINPSGLNYTLSDGTVVHYGGITASGITAYYVESVTHPDGEIWTYTYNGFQYTGVVSNSGYMIKRDHETGNVTLINLDVDYCDPAATSCTYSVTWPSLSYSSTDQTAPITITDALGRQTQYSGWDGLGPMYIVTPEGRRTAIGFGNSTSNCGVNVGRVTSLSKGSSIWAYAYDWNCTAYPDSISSRTMTTTVTSPLGNRTTAKSSMMYGQVGSITNQSGYTETASTYLGQIAQVNMPEGDKYIYSFDSRNNYTGFTHIAKDGTTSIGEQLVFSSTCTNVITCNRPTAYIDGNGNETDYTYGETHGGILTETGPADANGIRPQTRYSYSQLSAHYQTSSGVWASGNPIWKLTSKSFCKTTSSCTGTDDEVVTSYTYNDNLLPLTETISSGTGTVYSVVTKTYDSVGNITSVDGPLSGPDDTIYYFYDAARQKIGEIGPSPDGTKPRNAARTTYDLDGFVVKVETGTATGPTLSDLNAMNVCKEVDSVYDSSTGYIIKKTDTALNCN